MCREACGFAPGGVWGGCGKLWHVMCRGWGSQSGTFSLGVERLHMMCQRKTCTQSPTQIASGQSVKASTAADAAWLGKDRECSFVPGLGLSKAAAWVTLWSPCAETNAESSWSRTMIHLQTFWWRVCLLSTVVWASVIENRLQTHSVGRGCMCWVPFSGALCAGLWARVGPELLSSYLFALFRTKKSALHFSMLSGRR